MLTQTRLKELLSYDPKTGVFKWKDQKHGGLKNNLKGQYAGTVDEKGYRTICVDFRKYAASRLAWLYTEGYFPENVIDHIDRNPKNDRRVNLRHVSQQCNTRNCKISSNNTSGVTGVVWDKRYKKWAGQISISRRNIHLGRYHKLIDAVRARWEAEKKYNWPSCNTTSSAYLYIKEYEAKLKGDQTIETRDHNKRAELREDGVQTISSSLEY